MKSIITFIVDTYKSNAFQLIWKDPVWSKVISVGIIFVISVIFTSFITLWNSLSVWSTIKLFTLHITNYLALSSQWLDNVIENDIANLFIRVFLSLTLALSLLYAVYISTKKYWKFPNAIVEEDQEPNLHEHPGDIFDYKIGKAFPGVYGLKWINNSSDAVHRLETLFKKPIRYTTFNEILNSKGSVDIFWWFRGNSSMYVHGFRRISGNICLLNDHEEVNISKIAIYRSSTRRFSYLYVETKPIDRTGFYDKSDMNEYIERYGHYSEPYALFGNRKISIKDYEDGATLIKGKVVSADEAISRTRHVSKYNFIIASQLSPYNDSKFDLLSKPILDGILSQKNSYNDLFNLMEQFRNKDKYEFSSDPYNEFLE